MSNILLLCPDFFQYKKIFVDSLMKKGHSVKSISVSYKLNFFTRILRKVSYNTIKKRFDKKFANDLKEIDTSKIDKVVVIFGDDFLKENNIDLLKEKINGRFIFYSRDSLANYKHILKYLNRFDRVYTFDKEDAIRYGFDFLPLFYSNECLNDEQNSINYDFCFVATMARNKIHDFYRVYEALPKNIKGYEYFYFSSIYSFIFNKIFHRKEMKHFNFKNSHFEGLNYSEYLKIVHSSKVVLDIPRENQNGLTIRTLESLAASKKIITTNLNIKDYEFYNSNNIIALDRDIKYIDKGFFDTEFDHSSDISTNYNIDNWVNIVFEL